MLCVCVDEKERRGRVLFSQEMVLAWSRTLLAPSQTPNRTPMRRVNHVIGLTQPSSFNVPTHASTPWRQSIIALVQSCPRSKRERVVLADLRTIPPSLVSFKPLHTLSRSAQHHALLPRSLVIAPIVVSPLLVESSRASIDTSELSLWSSCSPCVWVVARLVTRHQSIHSFHSATRVSACCTRAPSHSHTLSPNVR